MNRVHLFEEFPSVIQKENGRDSDDEIDMRINLTFQDSLQCLERLVKISSTE
jgi:hypothetical protein